MICNFCSPKKLAIVGWYRKMQPGPSRPQQQTYCYQFCLSLIRVTQQILHFCVQISAAAKKIYLITKNCCWKLGSEQGYRIVFTVSAEFKAEPLSITKLASEIQVSLNNLQPGQSRSQEQRHVPYIPSNPSIILHHEVDIIYLHQTGDLCCSQEAFFYSTFNTKYELFFTNFFFDFFMNFDTFS